ncbi:hypothetical protein C8A05DRAFT_31103 [Staphylotrichum tortipilum]|uniref:Fun14 family protein n=1 Tax=Staphylotrichum tortipilum TaxID=2831512 RepID=A0AAN6MQA5_9PEZI|nr:hypothetical protein C8A05DRAFT_31103 [Staphylotrichum longicolle]
MASPVRTLAQTLTRRFTTTSSAAANPLRRLTLRGTALPLTLGLTTGLLAVHHQRPMRFESYPVPSANIHPLSQEEARKRSRELLDAETIKQLSGGSLSGFAAGLLVSVFSKTIVLLAGIAMMVIQVAAHNGVDLVTSLQLRKRLNSSRILAALDQHTAFKLAFGLAFTLSAFMSF